jgi:hypothetical protein
LVDILASDVEHVVVLWVGGAEHFARGRNVVGDAEVEEGVSVASTKGGEESAHLQDFLLSVVARERMQLFVNFWQ